MSSHTPLAHKNARSFIRCSALRFAYPDGTPVFAGVDVALPPARYGLVGPNGAGEIVAEGSAVSTCRRHSSISTPHSSTRTLR
jgi:hypothetical protein